MVWSPPMVTSLVPSEVRSRAAHLDGLDGLVNVEGVHRDIAGIGDLDELERRHVHRGVVGAQQP